MGRGRKGIPEPGFSRVVYALPRPVGNTFRKGQGMKRLTVSVMVGAVAVAIPLAARQAGSVYVDALLKAAVAQKQVPMAVAMVADSRGIVFEAAHGAKQDAIFAVASMTKPITLVALMQLVEKGKVKLEEPAATYVPELGAVRVLDNGTLRPPKSPITVCQLLTHTSGFGYEFMREGAARSRRE